MKTVACTQNPIHKLQQWTAQVPGTKVIGFVRQDVTRYRAHIATRLSHKLTRDEADEHEASYLKMLDEDRQEDVDARQAALVWGDGMAQSASVQRDTPC